MLGAMSVFAFMRFFLFPFFFFNDTATTEIYTLSLHDALPISRGQSWGSGAHSRFSACGCAVRSEEHTSELQSPDHVVCRLLLEKKKRVANYKTKLFDQYQRFDNVPSFAEC